MWIFISALAVDSVQVCHSFITIKYLHSFSPQESSVCFPRETGEWIFAVRIWAKQEARICKLQVPSAIHADRLPEEDLFAKCHLEWCSSHMCKRYLFNIFGVYTKAKSCIYWGSLFFLSFKHIPTQAKQAESSVPLQPNCPMATTNLLLTQPQVQRPLSFSATSLTF